MDEPFADAAVIPLYYLAKFAKPEITVALSGDGGDEIFGGYPKYSAQKFIENFGFLSAIAHAGKNFVSRDSNYHKLFSSFSLPFAARQFIFGSGSFLPEEVGRLLKGEKYSLGKIFEEAIAYENKYKAAGVVNKSMYLDAKIQLPDWYMVKGDRATMANSLEMRNPLLDKNLAEYMFSLEGNYKIRNGQTKYLLKKIAARYIDEDIIYRRKSGFGIPLDTWIRGILKDLFEKYLFKDTGFFDMEYIRTLFEEHCNGKFDHRFKLLRIFSFNYWYYTYYER